LEGRTHVKERETETERERNRETCRPMQDTSIVHTYFSVQSFVTESCSLRHTWHSPFRV
jgi:hypothetical protein